MKYSQELVDGLQQTLPPFFTRQDAEKVTLGLFKGSYLAYLACTGKGPKQTKVGKKSYYLKKDFLEWIAKRRTHNDRYDFEPVKFGFRARRPENSDYGFEQRAEGTEESGRRP